MGIGIQWDLPPNTIPISLVLIIFLLRMMDNDYERKSKFCEEVTRKERPEFLIETINRCNNSARMAKEVGGHLARSPLTSWRNGDEDMVEWNERKGDRMYEMAEYYEKEAAKASRKLHTIIVSSDPIMYSWRRL